MEDLLKVNFDNLDGNLHFVIYGRNKDAIQCKNINEFINTIKKDIKPSSVIKIELGREKNNNDNIPNETFKVIYCNWIFGLKEKMTIFKKCGNKKAYT